jgi:hypothetical protein
VSDIAWLPAADSVKGAKGSTVHYPAPGTDSTESLCGVAVVLDREADGDKCRECLKASGETA